MILPPGFRAALIQALAARCREQTARHPELRFYTDTWTGAWAVDEADRLLQLMGVTQHHGGGR